MSASWWTQLTLELTVLGELVTDATSGAIPGCIAYLPCEIRAAIPGVIPGVIPAQAKRPSRDAETEPLDVGGLHDSALGYDPAAHKKVIAYTTTENTR